MQVSDAEWERLYAAKNSSGCYYLAIEEMRKKAMLTLKQDATEDTTAVTSRDVAAYLRTNPHGKKAIETLIDRISEIGRIDVLSDGNAVFYLDLSFKGDYNQSHAEAFSFVIPKE